MLPRLVTFVSIGGGLFAGTTDAAAGNFLVAATKPCSGTAQSCRRSERLLHIQLERESPQNPNLRRVAPALTCMLGKMMIDSIRAWITGGGADGRERYGRRPDELQLALAALLVEAAHSDNHFDNAERAIIAQLLERRFKLSQ